MHDNFNQEVPGAVDKSTDGPKISFPPDPTPKAPIEEPTQAPEQPMDSTALPSGGSKKKLTIVGAVVILLILAAVGVFAYMNTFKPTDVPSSMQEPSPTPTPAATADPTSGWGAYSGDGYSFKYPASFAAPTDSNEGDWKGVAIVMLGETQKASGRTQTELFDGVSIRALAITDTYTSAKDAADAFQKVDKEGVQNINPDFSVTDISQQTIGKNTAYFYHIHGQIDADVYFIDNGKIVLKITVSYAGADTDVTKYKATAEQVLSTFEFSGSSNSMMVEGSSPAPTASVSPGMIYQY